MHLLYSHFAITVFTFGIGCAKHVFDINIQEDADGANKERNDLFEGDIIIDDNGLNEKLEKWRNGEVPYKFANDQFSEMEQNFIETTLEAFKNYSCISPRPATHQDEDYVLITGNQSGCFSHIGRVGKVQILNLEPNKIGRGCLTTAEVNHQFLHTLGFHHQHTSPHRDNYITIHWDNIDENNKPYFKKRQSDILNDFDDIYDYKSVLHFSPYAYSENGRITIGVKNPRSRISRSRKLSKIDVIKLNKVYNCTTKEEQKLLSIEPASFNFLPMPTINTMTEGCVFNEDITLFTSRALKKILELIVILVTLFLKLALACNKKSNLWLFINVIVEQILPSLRLEFN